MAFSLPYFQVWIQVQHSTLGVLTFNKKKKKLEKGIGDTWKSQECTFTSQNKKSKLEISFVAKNWTKVPLLPAQVSPIFLYSSLMKRYQEASPSGLPAEMNVKDLLPISVFTLLRLYLVQTRDLELLRRKGKKEKVAVVLKHVLSESKAMLCLWGYTLSKGVQDLTWVFTDRYGILWREYNTLQSYWLVIWTHQLWGRTLYHKCRW